MIYILEPTATGLSPAQFWQFSGHYIQKIKKDWKIPVILHICGDTTSLIPEMVRTQCNGISLDSMVILPDVAQSISSNILILGNIDPVRVITHGTTEDVEHAVKQLLVSMKSFDNFILSSGCDIPLETPLKNIEVLMQTARENDPSYTRGDEL
jgi:uroporphyrinogen decarboxylase